MIRFLHACNGGSAGINSAEFYTCGDCGACIVEMDRDDTNRNLHTDWHARQPTPTETPT